MPYEPEVLHRDRVERAGRLLGGDPDGPRATARGGSGRARGSLRRGCTRCRLALPPVDSADDALSSSSPHEASNAEIVGIERPSNTPRRMKSRRLIRPEFSALTRSIGS